jgi:hypothetical protein
MFAKNYAFLHFHRAIGEKLQHIKLWKFAVFHTSHGTSSLPSTNKIRDGRVFSLVHLTWNDPYIYQLLALLWGTSNYFPRTKHVKFQSLLSTVHCSNRTIYILSTHSLCYLVKELLTSTSEFLISIWIPKSMPKPEPSDDNLIKYPHRWDCHFSAIMQHLPVVSYCHFRTNRLSHMSVTKHQCCIICQKCRPHLHHR